MIRVVVPALLIAVLSQAACARTGDEADEPVRVDSAGIALVTIDRPDRPLDWEFEPLLDLGSVEDGPTAFFRVFATSIGVDSTGNLYVLDAGKHRVSVFDRSGRHLRSYGREGRGPGELIFPAYMAVEATGGTAVYDFDTRALVLFDAQGSYTGVFPLSVPLEGEVASLDDGTIAAAVARPMAAADSAEVRLLLLGSDTVELASVRRIDRFQPPQLTCPIPALPSLFLPRVAWDAAGNRIALSDNVDYSVRVHDGSRLVGIWRRDLPRIPATLELAAWEVAGGDSLRAFGCAVGAEAAAAALGYADVVPIVKDIAVSPDGAVWLLRRTDVPGDYRIDVLDATGRYVGTLPPGSPFPALFRGPNEIVTVEPDEFDVPHVRVYRVTRGSPEP